MTHLHWRQTVTGIWLQQQALICAAAFAYILSSQLAADVERLAWAAFDLQRTVGDFRLGPVRRDCGDLAGPGAEQALQLQRWTFAGAAAGSKFPYQHKAFQGPGRVVQLHQPVAAIARDEANAPEANAIANSSLSL